MTHATDHGTIPIPEAEHSIPETPLDDLDRRLEVLAARRKDWAGLDIGSRIGLLSHTIEDTLAVADRWVEVAARAKGIDPDGPGTGEDWAGGPILTLRNLRLLKETLSDVAESGRPELPGEPTVRRNGQVVVPVFPTGPLDNVLFPGFSGEVWMEPSIGLDDLHRHLAPTYQPGAGGEGAVALVLGAGNVGSIGPMDALYQLFVHNAVVMLKMNPVNEHLGPIFEEAFAALIREDYLHIVYGGAEVGAHLTSHDLVDRIHMTGSDKTHDAIVFGRGEEGEQRRAANEPVNTKPITSELGNVTPVIVVPGPWSDRELRFQAANIATMLTNNAGFNCVASRVIVQHGQWRLRNRLLDEIRDQLVSTPSRLAYYPGAAGRWSEFVEDHPEAEQYGERTSEQLPWTLIPQVDPDATDEIAFTTEAFCSLMAEVELDAPRDVAAYLDRAVEFCNEQVWGTLSASILVHPRTLKDPRNAEAFERALEDLRYGSIVVNHWSAVTYAAVSTPWGPYPGSPENDIQSGRGVVHNSYLLDGVQKTIVRGPFWLPLKPAWFTGHKTFGKIGRRVAELEATGSPRNLPAIMTYGALG